MNAVVALEAAVTPANRLLAAPPTSARHYKDELGTIAPACRPEPTTYSSSTLNIMNTNERTNSATHLQADFVPAPRMFISRDSQSERGNTCKQASAMHARRTMNEQQQQRGGGNAQKAVSRTDRWEQFARGREGGGNEARGCSAFVKQLQHSEEVF